MSEQRGFFYPRSASGQASLLPPPPWYYSGDLLTVEIHDDGIGGAPSAAAPWPPPWGADQRQRVM